jgi:hypothetical protein
LDLSVRDPALEGGAFSCLVLYWEGGTTSHVTSLPEALPGGTASSLAERHGKRWRTPKNLLPKVLTPDHYSLVLCLRLGLTDRSP